MNELNKLNNINISINLPDFSAPAKRVKEARAYSAFDSCYKDSSNWKVTQLETDLCLLFWDLLMFRTRLWGKELMTDKYGANSPLHSPHLKFVSIFGVWYSLKQSIKLTVCICKVGKGRMLKSCTTVVSWEQDVIVIVRVRVP